jgi:hypothetical protein
MTSVSQGKKQAHSTLVILLSFGIRKRCRPSVDQMQRPLFGMSPPVDGIISIHAA